MKTWGNLEELEMENRLVVSGSVEIPHNSVTLTRGLLRTYENWQRKQDDTEQVTSSQ